LEIKHLVKWIFSDYSQKFKYNSTLVKVIFSGWFVRKFTKVELGMGIFNPLKMQPFNTKRADEVLKRN